MKKNYVTIHFKMRYSVPKRLGPEQVAKIQRLARAAGEMQQMTRQSITADESLLADTIDAVESLANVMKRARACGGAK